MLCLYSCVVLVKVCDACELSLSLYSCVVLLKVCYACELPNVVLEQAYTLHEKCLLFSQQKTLIWKGITLN